MACLPNDLDLMFPNEAGTPLDHWHFIPRHLKPVLKAAGCSMIRFHEFAILLIDQGENIKYIQGQLGQATASFTLDVYGHLMNTVNQRSARKLENTIFEKSGSKGKKRGYEFARNQLK